MKFTPTFVQLAVAAGFGLAGSHAMAYNCTNVAAWNAATAYNGSAIVKDNNIAYQSKWWTQNEAPATHSGQWDVWKNLGNCDITNTDTTPPTVPGSLAASAITASSITLSWAASTDAGSGVAGYDVYRNGTLVGSPTGTSYVDSGLAANTSYSYTVRAKDKAGNNSAQSSALSAKTSAAGSCAAAPATPTGLSAPSKSSTGVNLSWNGVTAGPNCTVQYRVLQGSAQAAQGAATTASINGLTPDTDYSFSVQAVNEAGTSPATPALTVHTDKATVGGKNVLGYFAQWGIYDRKYFVKNIDTSGSAPLLTHINYAFGNVRNNKCEVGLTVPVNEDTGVGGDAFADYTKSIDAAGSIDGKADAWDAPLRGNWGQLKKLKAKYPKLKVLISLGGWTYSRGFSEAAKPENRVAFVKSCVDAYIKGDLPKVDYAGGPGALAGVFDGIDIDWEYPAACGLSCGKPEDTANFTGLLAEFRKQLDAVKPGLLLSIAAPAGVDKIRMIEPDKFHPYLDFINVMTYDFHGGWEGTTGFHSPLYGNSNDPGTGDVKFYNTDAALQAYLNKGVPSNKLQIGIGFYGRGWTGVANVGNGLYQKGTAAPGKYEKGIEDYKILKTLGYPSFVDPQSRAQWIYNGTTFWSFDTPAQITEKMSYAKSKGLGGAFFWEFNGDDTQATLLKAISNGLK